MPDLKTIVANRLEELGLKPIPAARAVGLERGYINDLLNGRKKSISSQKLPLVARALQLDAEALARGAAVPQLSGEVGLANIAPPERGGMPRDIPVMGTVAGAMGTTGAFEMTPETVDFVARPPGLANARDVYALYVTGESMEPQFNAGDLIFVSPHKPVRVNDAVIIQEPNSDNGCPQAFIKIFQRKTETEVITRQHNPESIVTFKRHPGTVTHKVLTMNELMGI